MAPAALLVALLAGCSGSPDVARPSQSSAAGQQHDTQDATQDPTQDPSQDAPAVPTTASPSETPPEDVPPVLVLQGDGLGLLAADDSTAPLLFGAAPGGDVLQVVQTALGEVATVPLTCPQGPRTGLDVDGFRVLLDGDRFVGWTDRGAADRSTTTADGIGVGSRLEDLQSAVPDAQVQQDGAGATTFTSPGGLSGDLAGPDPAAALTSLSGGQTCPGAG